MIGKPEHDSRECDGVFQSGKVAWIGGITIIILSMGMPGIPGAGVICMTVLLQQLPVPTESVSLVMGIAPLVGMFLCMSNCTGDVVVTAIVARSAGEMDLDVYNA